MASDSKKAIRVIAYQNLASYRVPSSLSIKESYPLPPYSSVIGMVHAACDFKEYVPMQVSVQGQCESHTAEVYTRYEFGRYTKYEAGRHNIQLKKGNDFLGMSRGMGTIELLVDVCLVLHIVPEEEGMVSVIADGLKHPKNYLSLGRHEDLIRIDAVDICELKRVELEESLTLPFDAYIPLEQQTGLLTSHATIYRLHKNYSIDKALNIRLWEKVASRFVRKSSEIEEEACVWIDDMAIAQHCCIPVLEHHLPVFLA